MFKFKNKLLIVLLFALFFLFCLSITTNAMTFNVDDYVVNYPNAEAQVSFDVNYSLLIDNDYNSDMYLVVSDSYFKFRPLTDSEYEANKRYNTLFCLDFGSTTAKYYILKLTEYDFNQGTNTYTVSNSVAGGGSPNGQTFDDTKPYAVFGFITGSSYSELDLSKVHYIGGNARFYDTSEGGSGSDSGGGSDGGDTAGDSGDTSDSDSDYSWFDWLKEGVGSIVSNLAQGLENLVSLLDYINPFSENFILKGVLEFLGNILSYLNPFDENFILKDVIDFLGNILSYINPLDENFFGYKLIELLGDLLQFLFVPSEERITALTDTVSSKFSFVTTISNGINSLKDVLTNTNSVPSITISLGASKYTNAFNFTFDLAWFSQFKPYTDIIITGFVYIAYLWRLFIKLPGILVGSAGTYDTVISKEEKL